MDDYIRTDFTQPGGRRFCCLQSCSFPAPAPIHTPKRGAGTGGPREEPLQAPGHPSSFACLPVIGQPLAWGLSSWDFLLPLLVPLPLSPPSLPYWLLQNTVAAGHTALAPNERSLSVPTQNHLNASRSCCPHGHLSPATSRQRELPGNTQTRTGVGQLLLPTGDRRRAPAGALLPIRCPSASLRPPQAQAQGGNQG